MQSVDFWSNLFNFNPLRWILFYPWISDPIRGFLIQSISWLLICWLSIQSRFLWTVLDPWSVFFSWPSTDSDWKVLSSVSPFRILIRLDSEHWRHGDVNVFSIKANSIPILPNALLTVVGIPERASSARRRKHDLTGRGKRQNLT